MLCRKVCCSIPNNFAPVSKFKVMTSMSVVNLCIIPVCKIAKYRQCQTFKRTADTGGFVGPGCVPPPLCG